MSCGISMVKYLLFLFNFVFVLLGAAILGVGVYVLVSLGDIKQLNDALSSPPIILVVLGAIVFLIAFFGCCGAIRESHCMVITYAVFLLTILIIQVAFGIWVFVLGNNFKTDSVTTSIRESYEASFNNYWTSEGNRTFIDTIQSDFTCCGVDGSSDFANLGNTTIPWSCCGNAEGVACTTTADIYSTGCITKLINSINHIITIIGGVVIGVAVTELVGIIFALCLANSIRNDDRRGYRV